MWYDVEPIEGTFTINTGDVMQVWSNDAYLAPEHRVKAQPNAVRCSAPFFYNPSWETTYQPVHKANGPARYNPIRWKDFRLSRFAGDFADVGKEI